jgi:hypothetical protein
MRVDLGIAHEWKGPGHMPSRKAASRGHRRLETSQISNPYFRNPYKLSEASAYCQGICLLHSPLSASSCLDWTHDKKFSLVIVLLVDSTLVSLKLSPGISKPWGDRRKLRVIILRVLLYIVFRLARLF